MRNRIINQSEQKKTAYIATPYAGNIFKRIRNIIYAKKVTLEAIYAGYVPITPHLYLTRVLKDRRADERNIGLNLGLELMQRCDVMVVGARYGISEGMRAEIQKAESRNIPIKFIEREVRAAKKELEKRNTQEAALKARKQKKEEKKRQRSRGRMYIRKAIKCWF